MPLPPVPTTLAFKEESGEDSIIKDKKIQKISNCSDHKQGRVFFHGLGGGMKKTQCTNDEANCNFVLNFCIPLITES